MGRTPELLISKEVLSAFPPAPCCGIATLDFGGGRSQKRKIRWFRGQTLAARSTAPARGYACFTTHRRGPPACRKIQLPHKIHCLSFSRNTRSLRDSGTLFHPATIDGWAEAEGGYGVWWGTCLLFAHAPHSLPYILLLLPRLGIL